MAEWSLTNVSNLFKIKYGKLSENVYNSYNVLLGRIMKDYDFTGKQKLIPVPQSFSGGVGSGTLPTANYENVEDAVLTAKKVYARVLIDRESIKAASSDEGSFVRQTKHSVQKTVESYMRNCSRILLGNGTGALGTGDNSTNLSGAGTVGDPYLVVISAASWNEAHWEERDYINYASETTLLEVQAVDPDTKTISLVGTSAGLFALIGAPIPGIFYMQGSKDNDPMGLRGALMGAIDPLYTVPLSRRWRAGALHDAGGAGITVDMMNSDMLEIEKKCGKVPNLIAVSYTQFRKIINLLEDHKEYAIDPRTKDLKGKLSFKGVEFMSSQGSVPMFPERFVNDDEVFYLNDSFIQSTHRPGFGWFDDDGTVFLRDANSDQYEARYGGYYQTYIAPVFHGLRYGLAT